MHSISQRLSYASFVTAFAFLVFPLPAYMQEELGNGEGPGGLLGDHLDQSQKCFSDYQFGSVQFIFDREQHQVTAGANVAITGKVHNSNQYPLAQGKILARVIREDDSVADKNWHPTVFEATLPDDYSIAAQSDKPFTFVWDIPSKAPKGYYRIEFFYLAGNHTILAGIPYVPNVSGGSVLLKVEEAASPVVLTFNRSSVLLQGNSLELRSVPPVLPLNEPVKISVTLHATGASNIPFQLKTALYAWSDTDGNPPLLETNSDGIAEEGQSLLIPFEWNDSKPGVHQLVITATPKDSSILPSIIKIRFPIEGNVPRILYSGFGSFSSKEAVVTTCVVNSTFGEAQASVHTKVFADGVAVGELSKDASSELSTINLSIPREKIAGNITIETEARSGSGEIVDSQKTTYTPDLLPKQSYALFFWVVAFVIIGALFVIATSIHYLMKKRYTL